MKKIDIFDSYKPFRNYLRKFHLQDSLELIWHYHQVLSKNITTLSSLFPTPFKTLPNLEDSVFLWELDILTKELMLNAGLSHERSLSKPEDFYRAINFIRNIYNEIAKRQGPDNALRNLHSNIHQQFPWQRPPCIENIMRYSLIFGDSDVNSIIEKKIGLTIQQLYILGLAISGHFLKNWGMSINQDYSNFGINNERRELFFKRITSDFVSLKQNIKQNQQYNVVWGCTFNPLRSTPLIAFDTNHLDRVICPLPTYLIKRVSEGVFYDVVGEIGFDEAYGKAYQEYVGKVLKHAFSLPKFEIFSEKHYFLGKNRKHGVDWILKDNTGAICIECKTKRLRWDAKFNIDNEDIASELENMAKFIVQNYKNIEDIKTRRTNWQYDGCPIYPVIITLEDWFLLNPVILKELDQKVCLLLTNEGIDQKVLKEMPYSVIPVGDTEIIFQIINHIGITPYAKINLDRKYPQGPIAGILYEKYKDINLKILFEKEFNELTELISTLPCK